jgi:hypothetical protein
MCDYLRKFTRLQALTINSNPFCLEEELINANNNDPAKDHVYPHSYDPFILHLEKLKYLDYRPIDEDYVNS